MPTSPPRPSPAPSQVRYAICDTPIGPVGVARTSRGLCRVELDVDERGFCESLIELTGRAPQHDPALQEQYEPRFTRFLEGRLRRFEEPLDFLEGTPFEQRVWRAMRKIPWGTTRSYKWLAKQAGRPLAARAVGQANRKNPIALMVPCHRVIQADGSLGGYGGRPELKRALLAREGVRVRRRLP